MEDNTFNRLKTNLALYPGMEAEDCVKLLYQAEMGIGHLIGAEDFENVIAEELEMPVFFAGAPYETQPIGGGLCRVDLSAQGRGLAVRTLARLCLLTAQKGGNEAILRRKLEDLRALIAAGQLPLKVEQANRIEEFLKSSPLEQPRHSQRYQALYRPQYRLMGCQAAKYLPVFTAVDRALSQKSHVLVGIDGMSATGKTSLAVLLNQVYRCGIIHADDFFLQPHQRTPARLAQPGGNIDYERLAAVLPLAKGGRAFHYQAYDCQRGEMGEMRMLPASALTVLEGSYALHPKLRATCDVRVFLSVDAREQMGRIVARNGPVMARRFKEEWIPMENHYAGAFGIREGCDVILDTTG